MRIQNQYKIPHPDHQETRIPNLENLLMRKNQKEKKEANFLKAKEKIAKDLSPTKKSSGKK